MHFNYLICLDFQATCYQNGINQEPVEIIEIAAILRNTKTGKSENEFRVFVRPTFRPRLSRFRTKLTGISQTTIDRLEPFPVQFQAFTSWLTSLAQRKGLACTSTDGIRALRDGPNATFCSWSDDNLSVVLRSECERHQIICPSYLKAWINMQKRFKILHPVGIGQLTKFSIALNKAGIKTFRRRHTDLKNALGLPKLVMHIINKGLWFSTANDYYT